MVVHRMNTDDRNGARVRASDYDRMLARIMEARLESRATR